MPCTRVDVAMHELVASLSALDPVALIDRLSMTASAVTGAAYAGFVRVDPLGEAARLVHVHAPPDDPLRVRPWLADSGVLKIMALSPGPARLPHDPAAGEPGFLFAPVPLATREHVLLWVAGRAFRDRDEHLLSRLATAAGRALEAASGLEAAVRVLNGVHAFTTA